MIGDAGSESEPGSRRAGERLTDTGCDVSRGGAVYRARPVKLFKPFILMVLVFLLPACSGKASVLTAGYERFGGKSHSPNAEKATAQAVMAERSWEHEIQSRARRYPEKRFANPSRDELMGELRVLAQKNAFEIVSVRLLTPRQRAPKIVVRTKHYLDLAHATPAILRRLDPRAAAPEDSQGWRYEGFYFEAQDEHGIPFLIAFNFWRGASGGGGQWARSEPLYPFAHG